MFRVRTLAMAVLSGAVLLSWAPTAGAQEKLDKNAQFCEDFDFAQGSEDKVVDAPVNIRETRGATAQRPPAGRRVQEAPATAPAPLG